MKTDHYSATYSPDDNKLRLYAITRLPEEVYARVKAAGFKWAPKQQLFVAPAWTPDREDLLLELCGTIGDEDTSLLERAEERADRFEGYGERRAEEAEATRKGVARLADNIPFGQPILVGHHSEKRARKDAERIENGLRKAVNLWKTSKYWTRRAAGAISHAKYKERPVVRARRIRTLEADQRRNARALKQARTFTQLWQSIGSPEVIRRIDGTPSTVLDRARYAAKVDPLYHPFPISEYPRPREASSYEGPISLLSALDEGIIDPAQAASIATAVHQTHITYAERWLEHLENRLTYERALLQEQGGSDLLTPKRRQKPLPLCNYRAPNGVTCENIYHAGETVHYPQVEMRAGEYVRIHKDYKGTRVVAHSHRVRTAMINHRLVTVFLTDSKVHAKPEDQPDPLRDLPAPRCLIPSFGCPAPEANEFDALEKQLQQGIEVVTAPQLFVTPPWLAARIVERASVQPHMRVLEPSAGTGNILRALPDSSTRVAVEINPTLANAPYLQAVAQVHCGDFLTCGDELGAFDRILMNPPFAKGQDVEHVFHALKFLKPNGRLVAILSAGVTFRQDRRATELRELIAQRDGTIENLPEDTFVASGTHVRTVLVTMNGA